MKTLMPSAKPTTLVLLAISAIVLAQPALAQLGSLTRVEQGYSDVEPNARSLRVQPLDLRQSVGFDILYKGTWADPGAAPRDVFARRHGAITAVFPRSSYVQTENGVVPEIPAGTIFYFGDVPPSLEESTGRQQAAIERLASTPGRRNLRRETAVPSDPYASIEGQTLASPDVSMSIWTSETYRQIRVGRLLRAAAAAEHEAEIAPDDADS
jgi:hypothetical protein